MAAGFYYQIRFYAADLRPNTCYAAPLLKAWKTRDVRLVVEVATIARDETRLRLYNAGRWSRALHRVEWFGALHSGAA